MERSKDSKNTLFIRCTEATKRRYKTFAARYGLNYEAALNMLLDLADSHPELIETVWG